MNILIAIAIILICIIAFYVFVFLSEKDIIHDETTNRFYKYAKDTDNPHHAKCKNCGMMVRLIQTTRGEKYRGTNCMYCHYTIWFDLWKKNKEDL